MWPLSINHQQKAGFPENLLVELGPYFSGSVFVLLDAHHAVTLSLPALSVMSAVYMLVFCNYSLLQNQEWMVNGQGGQGMSKGRGSRGFYIFNFSETGLK